MTTISLEEKKLKILRDHFRVKQFAAFQGEFEVANMQTTPWSLDKSVKNVSKRCFKRILDSSIHRSIVVMIKTEGIWDFNERKKSTTCLSLSSTWRECPTSKPEWDWKVILFRSPSQCFPESQVFSLQHHPYWQAAFARWNFYAYFRAQVNERKINQR